MAAPDFGHDRRRMDHRAARKENVRSTRISPRVVPACAGTTMEIFMEQNKNEQSKNGARKCEAPFLISGAA
jgi:hypothetical protein